MRFIDLFAGIGGIRLGLEKALNKNGISNQCVFSCEISPHAQETYDLNFNETPHPDICNIETLPEHDLLLAGFPCQAFSYAGKKNGFADTRGTLFFEIERLLKNAVNKPKYLLLENVRGFTTHDKGRTYKTVLESLNKLGYEVEPLLLNSSNFSVPQNRVRIYLVCKLNNKPRLSISSNVGDPDSHKFKERKGHLSATDSKEMKHKVVAEIIDENVDKKYYCSKQFTKQLKEAVDGKTFESLHGVRLIDYRGGNSLHSWDLGIKGKCSVEEREFMSALIANRRKKKFGVEKDGKKLTIEQIKTFYDNKNINQIIASLLEKKYLSVENGKYNPVSGNMSFEVFKFLDPSSISITIVSTDAHKLGIVVNNRPRRITPRECARIQGFPDSFKLHPSDKWAFHQLGNSVSVPVITAIFQDIILHNNDFNQN